ncbi:hypothetical protein [Burkholderia aenigmatica]|uniref:hypothetical protein n=1 Tax=Burkholderia aenigmatica TaxID=2015348 RepID=UPI001178A158|nr:hypothetical protein [Burkholderia aenigmatica]
MEKEIIYEDDEIRVVWSPGRSDFVVITFGDLTFLAEGLRFFADVPLGKSEISAIGIMAKRGNWYPYKHVMKAAEAVRGKIFSYHTRISYGGSMGGYAAIKFSRLFAATGVISLCPQWSIDSAEFGGRDPGWGQHYKESMREMGIKSGDVSGDVFLFADSFDKVDMLHRRKIEENCSQVHFINVPLVGHNVTTVFAGTANLVRLLDACRTGDVVAMHAISRHSRKNHSIWHKNILQKMMQKYPRHGVDIMTRLAGENSEKLLIFKDYFLKAIDYIFRRDGIDRAMRFLRVVQAMVPNLIERQLFYAYLAQTAGARVGIFTSHESYFVFNIFESRCIHKTGALELGEIPVEVEIAGCEAVLYIRVAEAKVRLSVDDAGSVKLMDQNGKRARDAFFEIVDSGVGGLTFKAREFYICAEPDGSIVCNRREVSTWESFNFGLIAREGGCLDGMTI